MVTLCVWDWALPLSCIPQACCQQFFLTAKVVLLAYCSRSKNNSAVEAAPDYSCGPLVVPGAKLLLHWWFWPFPTWMTIHYSSSSSRQSSQTCNGRPTPCTTCTYSLSLVHLLIDVWTTYFNHGEHLAGQHMAVISRKSSQNYFMHGCFTKCTLHTDMSLRMNMSWDMHDIWQKFFGSWLFANLADFWIPTVLAVLS